MKIDNDTLVILKNFSTIDQSILVEEGNVLKAFDHKTQTIFAKATVKEHFPRFAIHNLNRFLSVLSLFNDPNLDFSDKFVNITDASGKSLFYTYAEESTIHGPPSKDINFPRSDVSFKLTNIIFKDIIKAAAVLEMSEILIVGNGEEILIQTSDIKNPSGDIYSIKVGETEKEFRFIFKLDNLKTLPLDYDVEICYKGPKNGGLTKFKHNNIEYYIAIEKTSTYKD